MRETRSEISQEETRSEAVRSSLAACAYEKQGRQYNEYRGKMWGRSDDSACVQYTPIVKALTSDTILLHRISLECFLPSCRLPVVDKYDWNNCL